MQFKVHNIMKKEPDIKGHMISDSLHPTPGRSKEKTLSIICLNVIDCRPMG